MIQPLISRLRTQGQLVDDAQELVNEIECHLGELTSMYNTDSYWDPPVLESSA